MSVLGIGFPSAIRQSRPANGRGNPNSIGLMGLLGQEFTDLTTGKVWMKGGPLRELGWFPIGSATGNPTVVYGTAGQISPIGVVAAAGPAVWYGANGSIWVKTDPGNDTLNWHGLIDNSGVGPGGSGSGAADPWFGFSSYQMNNPTRANGVTHLTWTVPDFANKVTLLANTTGVSITVFFNNKAGIDPAKSRTFPTTPSTIIPVGVNIWGVTGNASDYTPTQLESITQYLTTSEGVLGTLGAALGTGHKVAFHPFP